MRRLLECLVLAASARIGRSTEPDSVTDPACSAVLATSATIVRSEHLVRGLELVAEGSRSTAVLAALLGKWQALHWAERRRMSGTTVLVAAMVHLLLVLWAGTTPGWLWLAVPGVTLAVGLLLIVASFPSRELR